MRDSKILRVVVIFLLVCELAVGAEPSERSPLDITKKSGNVSGMLRGNLGILRIFWLAAILLVGGGQILHFVEDFRAVHEATAHACAPDHENCPSDNSCCQVHAHMLTALLEDFHISYLQTMTGRLFPDDAHCLEGPFRKIDHPPQLS